DEGLQPACGSEGVDEPGLHLGGGFDGEDAFRGGGTHRGVVAARGGDGGEDGAGGDACDAGDFLGRHPGLAERGNVFDNGGGVDASGSAGAFDFDAVFLVVAVVGYTAGVAWFGAGDFVCVEAAVGAVAGIVRVHAC